MKRADLNVGDELFYRRGKFGPGEKAVVVATDRYAAIPIMWDRRGELYRKSDDGVLVMVDVHLTYPLDAALPDGPHVKRMAVTLASLLGPYAEVKAREDAVKAEARRRDGAAAAGRRAIHDEASRLADLAAELGLADVYSGNFAGSVMSVSPSTLALLLDTYAAQAAVDNLTEKD